LARLATRARLAVASHDARLYDKGQGVGGRMATRRVTTKLGDAFFDHEAQYLTARTAEIASCIDD